MAKSISEEELQLRKRARRRLIGAVALVAAVVIFLPMVLDNEPKPATHDIDIKIPSPNSDNFISKIVPLVSPTLPSSVSAPSVSAAAPSAPMVAVASSPLPPAVASPSSPPSISVPSESSVADKSESTSNTEARPKKNAVLPKSVKKVHSDVDGGEKNGGGGSFVVQVAALDDMAKAKRLEGQLTGADIKAYIETVPTAKGKVTRVRVGPFKTREEAEKMRAKLKNMGLSGNIVPK